MDPITLLVLAVIGLAATKVALLTWQTVQQWIASHRVPGGVGRIVNERLQNGEYKVVTGVFNGRGTLVSRNHWKATRLDDDLASEFRKAGGTIVVHF